MERRREQRKNVGFCLTMATRFLTLGAAIIISCLLISIGMYQLREARWLSSLVSKRINALGGYLSNADLAYYDGILLSGSDVVNFYRRYIETENYEILFCLRFGQTEQIVPNNVSAEALTNPDSDYYVRPSAVFFGHLIQSENDVILGITFETDAAREGSGE